MKLTGVAQWGRVLGVVFFFAASYLPVLNAEDWARFRGPDGRGISRDKLAPMTWSNSENMQWKTELPGPGLSSPIVVGDKVFVTCYSGYGLNNDDPGNIDDLKRHLVCVERKSGEILWQKSVAAVQPEDPYKGFITEHGYASQTPASDGEKVFVFFGKTGVLAFDLDGNQLWQTSVGTESGRQKWGSAASPLIYENLVIVNASDESKSLIALNKETGKEVWRETSDSLASNWSTPILMEGADSPELLMAVVGQVWGRDPQTGELKWFTNSERATGYSTSLIAGDGVAYCAGGMQGGASFAVKPGGHGDVTASHVLWSTRSYDSIISPVLASERLYGVTNKGIAYAVEAETGDKVYQTRISTGEVIEEEENADGRRPGGQGGGPAARPGGPRDSAPEGRQRPTGQRQEGQRQGRGGPSGGRRSGGPGGGDYASPVMIDGKIYSLTKSGTTYVVAPDAEFKVLARNEIAGDESGFYASPAVSDGQIFIRSNQNLYCISSKP